MYSIEGSVLDEIRQRLIFSETGGILGIDGNRVVTKFYYDSTGQTTDTNYIPDIQRLNEVIQRWATDGIKFVGFVHSHPASNSNLSATDIAYAEKIKVACGMADVLMLLYVPADDKFFQYIV